MRIGMGLPAAVPDPDATVVSDWAADAERAGFASVGVIDRLVYADSHADRYVRHYHGDEGGSRSPGPTR